MMAVHEAGHCLGAVGTGGRIEKIELPLLGFSRTDVSGGRHPLVVAWAGPFVGAALPLVVLALPRSWSRRTKHVARFFAGFCLLANGVYLGAGSFSGAGDCHELLSLGCPAWTLVAFGFVSAAGGLFVLHGMGPLTDWFRDNGNLRAGS